MPLPDANKYSDRVYELLKETDLENLSYNQYKNVIEKLFIEPENEDEMRRAVLIQMARTAVRGDWDGFLTGGGGSGAPTDAEYVVMALNGTLTNERKLTAGSRITITDGGAGGDVTIAADASPVTSLVAGTNISLSPVSGLGDVTITAATPTGLAPNDASYCTLGLDGDLTNERVLTAGTGIGFTDTGPNGTLTIEATGGGGSATTGLAPIAVQLDATYSRLQPWDVYTLNGVTLTNAAQDNYAIYWRFVAPKTGNLSEIAIRTNTTNTSVDSVIAGIYDIDVDGYPNSLLGSVTIDPNGGADIYTKAVTGTISLTAGATYWFATAMDNTGTTTPTLYVVDKAAQTSGLGLSHYNGTVYNCIRSTSTANSLPASFVKGDNQLNKINHVAWTIKY